MDLEKSKSPHVFSDENSKLRRSAELRDEASRRQLEDIDDNKQALSLSLHDFQSALELHPDARRLVVVNGEEGFFLQPCEADPTAPGKNQTENRTTLKILKEIISLEHSPAIAESIPSLNALALLKADSLSAEQLREIFQKINQEPLSQTTLAEKNVSSTICNSIFQEPAFLQEKKEAVEVLQKLIEASTIHRDGSRYYKEADQLWQKEQQAWEERAMAQRNLEEKNGILQQAQELLAKVTAARAELDIQTTLLGRISKYSAQAAVPLSFIPAPVPCGGIAHTVSGVTDKLNQIWVNKDVILAEHTVNNAKKEVDQATQQVDVATKNVGTLHQKAQQAEEQARILEYAARKDDIERLLPPVTSFDEMEWQEWATRLVRSGQGDPFFISMLVNHGMSDPLWAEEIIQQALKKRVEGDLQKEAEQRENIFMPLEVEFQQASKALQEVHEITTQAEKNVLIARQRLESATQIHQHWKKLLEESNDTLNELEKPEQMRKPGNAQELEREKKKFCVALTEFEQACNDLKKYEEALKQAHEILAFEENKTLPLQHATIAAEKKLQRQHERDEAIQDQKNHSLVFQQNLRLPKFQKEEAITPQQLKAIETTKNHEIEQITLPEILDKIYETIGRALLSQEQKIQQGKEGELDKEITSPQENFKAPVILLPEIREPAPEDLARWDAARLAEDFIDERDHVIDQIKERYAIMTTTSAAENNNNKKFSTTSSSSTKSTPLSLILEEPTNRDSEDLEQDNAFPTAAASLRLGNIQRQNENSNASTTSVSMKSARTQSSLGSFVTAKTGLSKTGSVANSIPDSISSMASRSEVRHLKSAISAINKAAGRWAEMVRLADAQRVAAGGAPYLDEETLFEAWQQADLMAEAAWKKRSHLQEEMLRVATMARTWEANTLRWEARAEADRLLEDQMEAEADLVSLAEKQEPLGSTWQSQYQAISEHLQQVEKEATAAQKKWSRLAELEENVKRATNPEEKKKLLLQLRDQDKAVVTLWQRVEEDYYKEKEFETRRAQKERIAQETGSYKFDLNTQKNELMSVCFNDSFVDEEKGIARYAEVTMEEALKAARERIPGAEAAWVFRVSKALKDQREAEKKIETPQALENVSSSSSSSSNNLNDLNETNLKKIATRLKAIAEADEQALESFKKENLYFDTIETIWKHQLQAEEKNTLIKRITAAKKYQQRDSTAWESLSHQARTDYNNAVSIANELFFDRAVNKLKEAQENTQIWNLKARKAWVFSKKSTEQIAKQAVAELTKIKAGEDERRVAMHWARMKEFSCQVELEEKMVTRGPKSLAFFQHQVAERAWNSVKTFCDDLEISWAAKAKVLQAGYQQAAHYAAKSKEAWNQLAEAKRKELSSIPIKHPEFEKMMMGATEELMKAEKEKQAWSEKKVTAEKFAEALLDPKTLQVKAALEKIRAAWEAILQYPVSEVTRPMAELIRTQLAIVAEGDPQIYQALMSLSGTADALVDLRVAARKDLAGRFSGGTVIAASGGVGSWITSSFVGAGITTTAAAAGTAGGVAVFTGGIAIIPMAIIGGGIYYRYYRNKPLAPRTTEAARTAIQTAQEKIEAGVFSTIETIWAADTVWCREAIRHADELVTAITKMSGSKAPNNQEADVDDDSK